MSIAAAQRRAASTPFEAPDPNIMIYACAVCGCAVLDYDPGRDAHLIVFDHLPEQQVAA